MWGEIRDEHPRVALVAEVASSATGSLKLLVETFYKDARNQKSERNLPALIRRLNKSYLCRRESLSFEIICGWQNFERRSGESLADFWVRWKEGIRLAKEQEALESDTALYIKAMRALKLTPAQKDRITVRSEAYKDASNGRGDNQPLSWRSLERWTMVFVEDQKDKG